MSAAISCSTGKTFGVARVCSAWGVARSSHYARKARRLHPDLPSKRGPRPLLSDKELLVLIRADLARSPFIGEGHRKVWARLRFVEGVKVSRKRVLRIMRQEHLLSPHRGVQGVPKEHDGTIITAAPDIMWGTDGTKVFTLDEGWCWLFTVVEHWNAECVGWHVAKTGDRFAALQPLSMGLNIHGRHYRNAEELRAAVGVFVETYNRHWLLEKLGFKSPWQARQEFDNQLFKTAA